VNSVAEAETYELEEPGCLDEGKDKSYCGFVDAEVEHVSGKNGARDARDGTVGHQAGAEEQHIAHAALVLGARKRPVDRRPKVKQSSSFFSWRY